MGFVEPDEEYCESLQSGTERGHSEEAVATSTDVCQRRSGSGGFLCSHFVRVAQGGVRASPGLGRRAGPGHPLSDSRELAENTRPRAGVTAQGKGLGRSCSLAGVGKKCRGDLGGQGRMISAADRCHALALIAQCCQQGARMDTARGLYGKSPPSPSNVRGS